MSKKNQKHQKQAAAVMTPAPEVKVEEKVEAKATDISEYEAKVIKGAELLREAHLARVNAERKRDFTTVAAARATWQAIRKSLGLTAAEAAVLTKKSAQRV